jgi:hypothetical protein
VGSIEGHHSAALDELICIPDDGSASARIQLNVACASPPLGRQELRPRAARRVDISSQPVVLLACPRTNLADDQAVAGIEYRWLFDHRSSPRKDVPHRRRLRVNARPLSSGPRGPSVSKRRDVSPFAVARFAALAGGVLIAPPAIEPRRPRFPASRLVGFPACSWAARAPSRAASRRVQTPFTRDGAMKRSKLERAEEAHENHRIQFASPQPARRSGFRSQCCRLRSRRLSGRMRRPSWCGRRASALRLRRRCGGPSPLWLRRGSGGAPSGSRLLTAGHPAPEPASARQGRGARGSVARPMPAPCASALQKGRRGCFRFDGLGLRVKGAPDEAPPLSWASQGGIAEPRVSSDRS